MCDTNAIILLIMVIVTDTYILSISKKSLSRISNPKNSMWRAGKILKLWSEKAIAEISILLSCGV